MTARPCMQDLSAQPLSLTFCPMNALKLKPQRKLISIVVPCFNEEPNIANTFAAIAAVFSTKLEAYDYEVVFCDNRSTDKTFAEIQKLAHQHKHVRGIRYSRNFGFNRSLITGYRVARGDAAIQLDCDLQDPPNLFPTMIQLWEKGHDVVVGRRTQRPEPFWLQQMRRLFYRGLARISPDNLVIDGGDFRLVDRHILNQLRGLHEALPYVRGLVSSLAKHQTTFPYTRNARLAGESKYPVRKLIGLALEGVFAHSVLPLKLATMVGLMVALCTMVLGFGYFIGWLLFGVSWPEGFTTLVLLQLTAISLNAVFLGIIGEYISRLYQQQRERPLVVIADAVNLADADLPEWPASGIRRA